jgi:5-methylcytosine-specific restriction endonuclease McrA
VEIDHIVPYSLAPEAGNELANLEMMPQELNRAKSNRVGSRQLSHAEKLFSAGVITKESLAKVRTRPQSPRTGGPDESRAR